MATNRPVLENVMSEGNIRVGETRMKQSNQQSVEEAKAAMIAAGEAPKGIRQAAPQNTDYSTMSRAERMTYRTQVASGKAEPNPTPTVIAPRASGPAPASEVIPQGVPTEIHAILEYVDGTQEELVVPTREDLVAAVDAKSKALREAGQPTRIQVNFKIRRKTEPESNTLVVENESEPQATPIVSTAKKVDRGPIRQETKDFIAELKQENGQWVGTITYKNGGGTERFSARSKSELTMAMLVGKGNATLKIRKSARERKLGLDAELDKTYTFKGVTQEEYDTMTPAMKQTLVDATALQHAVIFKNEHPEYYSTTENWETIKRFLDKRELPYTYTNLEYAYGQLSDDELLEVRPTESVAPIQTVTPTVTPRATQVADSTAPAGAPTAAPSAPAPVLRKRGTTGMLPGSSSDVTTELDLTEESNRGPRELSEAELKALPLSEHKKLYRASLKRPTGQYDHRIG